MHTPICVHASSTARDACMIFVTYPANCCVSSYDSSSAACGVNCTVMVSVMVRSHTSPDDISHTVSGRSNRGRGGFSARPRTDTAEAPS